MIQWRSFFVKVSAGLMIGALLAASQWYDPKLLPWAVGLMLATFGHNVLQLMRALQQQNKAIVQMIVSRDQML